MHAMAKPSRNMAQPAGGSTDIADGTVVHERSIALRASAGNEEDVEVATGNG